MKILQVFHIVCSWRFIADIEMSLEYSVFLVCSIDANFSTLPSLQTHLQCHDIYTFLFWNGDTKCGGIVHTMWLSIMHFSYS